MRCVEAHAEVLGLLVLMLRSNVDCSTIRDTNRATELGLEIETTSWYSFYY